MVDSGCDFLIDRGGFVVERSGRDPLVVYPSGSTTCTLSSFSPFVETLRNILNFTKQLCILHINLKDEHAC